MRKIVAPILILLLFSCTSTPKDKKETKPFIETSQKPRVNALEKAIADEVDLAFLKGETYEATKARVPTLGPLVDVSDRTSTSSIRYRIPLNEDVVLCIMSTYSYSTAPLLIGGFYGLYSVSHLIYINNIDNEDFKDYFQAIYDSYYNIIKATMPVGTEESISYNGDEITIRFILYRHYNANIRFNTAKTDIYVMWILL